VDPSGSGRGDDDDNDESGGVRGAGADRARPKADPSDRPLDALIRITTTTICGTGVHILKGEYPVEKGLTIGHEPIGIIEQLGSAVEGCHEGQRVMPAR
jgi:threonine dehydrogenase-like Zn-dependent dehydrogenase